MRFFYINSGPYRVGFGVTDDPGGRWRQYASHVGNDIDCAKTFDFILTGDPQHIAKLEDLLKTKYSDMLLANHQNKPLEWLASKETTANEFWIFVQELIEKYHIDVRLIEDKS